MAIGGLSLAGFPLITAGFWSKDEIIAEAWHGMSHDPFPLLVLLLLVASAALTAFYTARMWLLAFWGAPRTPAAEYAGTGSLRKQWVIWWNRQRWSGENKLVQEYQAPRDRLSANQMEFPLVVLAFFSIFAGFIGIHEDILGKNPLHDFLVPTLLEHISAIGFNFAPMLVSMIIALGGLGLGFWIYGLRPLQAGQTDPAERALGAGIWKVLQNRFYLDILYRRYLLRPAEWLSVRVVIEVLDRETFDELLHFVADAAGKIGEGFKRFNTVVIDGAVDGTMYALADFARWFRQTQTGRVQQYLLFITLALLAIGTLFLIQVR